MVKCDQTIGEYLLVTQNRTNCTCSFDVELAFSTCFSINFAEKNITEKYIYHTVLVYKDFKCLKFLFLSKRHHTITYSKHYWNFCTKVYQ